jgi:CarD family transcriptional regulator
MRSSKVAVRTSSFPRTAAAKNIVAAKKDTKPKKAIEFEVGQKVVYPGHGVGQIQTIEIKEIAGTSISFYMIRILESDVTVMVPLNKVDNVGLRPTATEADVKEVYLMLRDKKVVVEQTTWNRRYREYMEKIKTGSVFEICEVLRDLCVIREDKILSFGERKMLELAKGLLVKELAIAEGTDEPTVEAQIEGIYTVKS